MANKHPNLPGVLASINDQQLPTTALPGGAVLAVLGTAQKGPSKQESSVLDGSTAVSRFGAEGSLGRGLSEAFQGGATSAIGYRILATPGKLEHLGDPSGVAGYTVQTTAEGSSALEGYSLLYDARSDRLRVYDATSGALVYDATAGVEVVNYDLVRVSGAADASVTDDGTAASVGLRVAVADDEDDQVFTGAAGNPAAAAGDEVVFTLDSSISGFNLNRLSVSGDGSEYMFQILDDDLAVMEEWPITAFSNGAATVTVAVPAGGDITNAAAFRSAGTHRYRILSRVRGERMDRILRDRLGLGGTSELRLTPGSDYNGLALTSGLGSGDDGTLLNGVRADLSLDEAEPAKMNLYEALVDAALALEAAAIDALVLMDGYLDDPALDGQTTGETALPTPILSDGAGTAAVKTSAVSTVAGDARRLSLVFADAATATSALNLLNAAGRGGAWFVASEAQGAAFGENIESDEIVRTGRVLSWEGGKEIHEITAAVDVAGNLDGTYFLVPYEADKVYKVWFDNGDSGTAEPALDAADAVTFAGFTVTGVEVNGLSNGDSAVDVANAIESAMTGLAGITVSASGPVVTVRAHVFGNLADAVNADTTLATGFAFSSVDGGATLDIHFDREMGFSLNIADEVVGSNDFEFAIYDTDLLFFHREKEIDGENKHFWYTAKVDPEANAYNEVNFAFRLATICHDMTENETSVIGCIGVRPPSNHYSPAAVSSWIGKVPSYDENGDVTLNGEGLLGNKFIAGRALDNIYLPANQFDAGFKATASGELDDTNVLTDSSGNDIDLGKYLSVVASWPVMSNFADSSGLGYIASGAPLYAGRLLGLPPWRGATAKQIGGNNIRLPVKLAKRHLNSLVGARYVVFSERGGITTVVDAPSAALPTSDFTRNMSVRLVFDAISRMRDVARPFLGDPLSAARKSALETSLKKALSDLQQQSVGALERFDIVVTQTPLDKVRGTARATVALQIVNELRVLTLEVALTI